MASLFSEKFRPKWRYVAMLMAQFFLIGGSFFVFF